MPMGVYKHKPHQGFQKGNNFGHISSGTKGMKMSQEFKENKRLAILGEKNPLWKGGVSKEISYYTKRNKRKRDCSASRPRPSECEICNIPGDDFWGGLCFDHDHITGKFRGWICRKCNFILGHSNDNIEVLESAIKYLKQFNKNI